MKDVITDVSSSESMSESIFPKEYDKYLLEVSASEKEIFFSALKRLYSGLHPYVRVARTLRTLLQKKELESDFWYLLLGRISFISADYKKLQDFWEENGRDSRLNAFVARVLVYQGKYQEVLELCETGLSALESGVGTSAYYRALSQLEIRFTLGLSYIYMRKFEAADEQIKKVEQLAKEIQKQAKLGETDINDLKLSHIMLSVLKNFFMGNTNEFKELLFNSRSLIQQSSDPWWKGFYFNLLGISYFQSQEPANGEAAWKKALYYFEQAHDLRGHSAVGANLGTALVLQGRRQEGREIIERVLDSFIELKNWLLAVGNSLFVSKSYLEEKNEEQAREYLKKAEALFREEFRSDLIILSFFCYLYSRLNEFSKAEQYLEYLREEALKSIDALSREKEEIKKMELVLKEPKKEKKGAFGAFLSSLTRKLRRSPKNSRTEAEVEQVQKDIMAVLWYYFAEAIYSMELGDLRTANSRLEEAIELADQYGHYDLSLEFSSLLLEIYIKRFIIEGKRAYLTSAIDLLGDLTPLIKGIENPYFRSMFHLTTGYLYLANEEKDKALEEIDHAKSTEQKNESAVQWQEISLIEKRLSSLTSGSAELQSWLSGENLAIILALEAMRLSYHLQFQQVSTGTKVTEKAEKPIMLVILRSDGLTLYSYTFKEETQNGEGIDEQIIGGFLMAITSFSQEMFGGGSLKRIEQDKHVILIERATPELLIVLLTEKDTYSIRKQFRRFIQQFKELDLDAYLGSVVAISNEDPQWKTLHNLVINEFSS